MISGVAHSSDLIDVLYLNLCTEGDDEAFKDEKWPWATGRYMARGRKVVSPVVSEETRRERKDNLVGEIVLRGGARGRARERESGGGGRELLQARLAPICAIITWL